MRSAQDKCLLCNKNLSDKKNSHIIPKFFGEGLFFGAKPRTGLLIAKGGFKKKIQDIIKEDYIFCSNCETGFSIFETYCAHKLRQFDKIRLKNNFQYYKRNDFQYIVSQNLDISVFNLFIYSIVWRVSVSTNPALLEFKLKSGDEEHLRQILYSNIYKTQTELLNNMPISQETPIHCHVIIRPERVLRPPNCMLSCESINEWAHILYLVDYILFYFTDVSNLKPKYLELNNNRKDGQVKIELLSVKDWRDYNKNTITKKYK